MIQVALVAVLVLGMAGCGTREVGESAVASRASEEEDSSIEMVAVPAGDGASAPFLSAARDGLLLSWLEPVAGSDRVAVRVSRSRGAEWSAPVTVVERGDLFVNWADFPSVVEDANGALFAHWLQKSGAGTYAYDVVMAVSNDGGSTWGRPFLLNRDGKQAEHGFVTLVPLSDGGVGATWLDGRNMSGGGEHDGHDGHESGDMTLRYATVDANGTLTGDVELDTRTCECCATGMTVTKQGPVIVYRDRGPDERRDIAYVRRTADGWTKPRLVNEDGWKINACPVNGPQIDASGDRVATAWFTAADEKGRAYVAFSDDGGATFAKPLRIDDGNPIGRVDVVMLDEASALVTWLEQTPGGGEIRARRVSAGGVEDAFKVADSSTARAAGFPRAARFGDHVYFAWTEQDADSKAVRVARRDMRR